MGSYVTQAQLAQVLLGFGTKLDEIEKRISGLEKAVQDSKKESVCVKTKLQALHDAFPAVKGNIERALAKISDGNESHETDILALKAKFASIQVKMAAGDEGRAVHHQGELAALIDSLQTLINRTNERHIKEANISCNCTHTLLQKSIGSMRKHINSVEKLCLKVKRQVEEKTGKK